MEALNIWKEHGEEIDLMLTDVVMPQKISGIELADKLWKHRQDLKVIFTSGYSQDTVNLPKEGQPMKYLQKPYSPTALSKLVRNILDVNVPTLRS